MTRAPYLLSDHSVDIARETGTLSELALALSARTPVLVFCGELSAAAATVAETQSVQEASGISSAPYGALILQAWQGNARATRELIETTLGDAGVRGEGIGIAVSEYAHAVLCNGRGEYEEALAAAVSASEHREVVAENWGLSELIEPATRTGRTDLANEALERLSRKARAARTEWAAGIEARSRALLSQAGDADRWFREAIDHLSRTRVRAELARAELLYGEWLRRHSRRLDARAQLRAAHDQFASMGMDAFAERAEQRAARDRREDPEADRRHARRPDRAGAPDRRSRPRRPLERRDRCPALPQPAHRRVAPAQGVRQARDPLAQGPRRRARGHQVSLTLYPNALAAAATTSSCGTSRRCWPMFQRCPKGSSSCP